MVCTDADGFAKTFLLFGDDAFALFADSIIDSDKAGSTEEVAWCFGTEFAFCLMLESHWERTFT